jgi:transposase
MRKALAAVRAENRRLAQQVVVLKQGHAALQAQLTEMTKLCELQQADLERYRQAVEASRPNHPERAPRDQLQLAFERVLETLGVTAPANDNESDRDQEGDDKNDSASGADQREGRRKRKKRHQHGRRALDLSNLPVIEDRIQPEEVKAAGGEGYRLIGEEASERVARRPAEWVRYRVVRLKYVALEAIAATTDSHDEGDDLVEPIAESASAADDRTRIVIAPLPLGLWPNTMGDASAIGHVILSKYGDLLPLNRQQALPPAAASICRSRRSAVGSRLHMVSVGPS